MNGLILLIILYLAAAAAGLIMLPAAYLMALWLYDGDHVKARQALRGDL